MENNATHPPAKLATLDALLESLIPSFLAPVPCRRTLRSLFDNAKIPRIKNNPAAKRGGGKVYYSVAHVDRLLRSRTILARSGGTRP